MVIKMSFVNTFITGNEDSTNIHFDGLSVTINDGKRGLLIIEVVLIVDIVFR